MVAKQNYTITWVATDEGPYTTTSETEAMSAAEAIAMLYDQLCDAYTTARQRGDGQYEQQAQQAAEWLERGGNWKGEPLKLLGFIDAVYLLPGRMTWQDYEADLMRRHQKAQHALDLAEMIRLVERANVDHITEVADVESYCQRAANTGKTATDMRIALAHLRRHPIDA